MSSNGWKTCKMAMALQAMALQAKASAGNAQEDSEQKDTAQTVTKDQKNFTGTASQGVTPNAQSTYTINFQDR